MELHHQANSNQLLFIRGRSHMMSAIKGGRGAGSSNFGLFSLDKGGSKG